MNETVKCCEVRESSIKETVISNYDLLCRLENSLSIIAVELKKVEPPKRPESICEDMASALVNQGEILSLCNEHANYIKHTLGIED